MVKGVRPAAVVENDGAEPTREDLIPITPIYIRPPLKGEFCPYFGISNTTYYELIQAGKIGSRVLRRRGAKRGIRLIHFQSAKSYFDSLPQ